MDATPAHWGCEGTDDKVVLDVVSGAVNEPSCSSVSFSVDLLTDTDVDSCLEGCNGLAVCLSVLH